MCLAVGCGGLPAEGGLPPSAAALALEASMSRVASGASLAEARPDDTPDDTWIESHFSEPADEAGGADEGLG